MLGSFKKCIITDNVPTTMQTDNETKFKYSIMNQIRLEINAQHIFETLFNTQHQFDVEAINRTVQDFF